MFGSNYSMLPFASGGMWWAFFAPLAILDIVLRGYTLWRSAQAREQWWFIALLVINSMGILPAIYLFMHPEVVRSLTGSVKVARVAPRKRK